MVVTDKIHGQCQQIWMDIIVCSWFNDVYALFQQIIVLALQAEVMNRSFRFYNITLIRIRCIWAIGTFSNHALNAKKKYGNQVRSIPAWIADIICINLVLRSPCHKK